MKCPPISSTATGTVSARPIQNRRVMSANSGLGRPSAVDVTGLERHPADRASARTGLPDLGMHRAGVDGAGGFGVGLRRSRLAIKVGRGAGREFRPATVGAEVIAAALELVAMRGRIGVDRHSTNRIQRARRADAPHGSSVAPRFAESMKAGRSERRTMRTLTLRRPAAPAGRTRERRSAANQRQSPAADSRGA